MVQGLGFGVSACVDTLEKDSVLGSRSVQASALLFHVLQAVQGEVRAVGTFSPCTLLGRSGGLSK